MRTLILLLVGLLALKAPWLIGGAVEAVAWTVTEPGGTVVIVGALGVTLLIAATRSRPYYERRWA